MRELRGAFRSPTGTGKGESPRRFEKQRVVTPGCMVVAVILMLVSHALGAVGRHKLNRLVDAAEQLEQSGGVVCVRWVPTQFCAGNGPAAKEPDQKCNAEILGPQSGLCICTRGVTVSHSCELGKQSFTCQRICTLALANPRADLGPAFTVLREGKVIPVRGALGEDAPIMVSRSEMVRRVASNATGLQGVKKFSKYPRMRDRLKYGWASQGGSYKGAKPNAVYLILTVEGRRQRLMETLRTFEDHVNKYLKYPYVAFNDVEFSEQFKTSVAGVVSTGIDFYKIPEEHWSVPSWIDKVKMKKGLKPRKEAPYMDSLTYRLMCRWNSGFFFREPILAKYDYFWRVDDDVFYYCPIRFDPFVVMVEEKKHYGFTIALNELMITIRTLWKTTKQFMTDEQITPKWDTRKFVKRNEYAGCHWWSNFEIGSFDFFRQPQYLAYFEYLDKNGGFFYERWGDAPVHFLATMLFLKPEEIEYFEGIAYAHSTIFHIPEDPEYCPIRVPERGSGDGIDDKPGAMCLNELEL